MRRKDAAGQGGEQRIRADLEERGVAPNSSWSETVAERLALVQDSGPPEAYEAALDAVALTYRRPPALAPRPHGAGELERLVSGFACELRKLGETLRNLEAYVTRMRTQTGPAELRPLH